MKERKKRVTDTDRLNWLVEQDLLPQRGVLLGGSIPGGEAARFVIDAALRSERAGKRKK